MQTTPAGGRDPTRSDLQAHFRDPCALSPLPLWPQPTGIKAILVATDLSVQGDTAVQRAGRLAQTHRATLTLVAMPARTRGVPGDAASHLANIARQLEESLGLRVRAVPVATHSLEDLAARARGMNLVVLPHRRERSAAAFFRGQPALRLLRSTTCPVLVTRRAGDAHYQRILVAVDLSPASEALVKLAASLEGRAQLELFHAIGTLEEARLRAAGAAEQAVRAYRERCMKDARQGMLALTEPFHARGNRLRTAIGRGDPGERTVLQQEHSGADLVVVGKGRSTAWSEFLCASVAHRVLGWGTSDVLIVPHAWVQVLGSKDRTAGGAHERP